jgi:glycine/D-amino acid oxidase-like deaminating enzyme
MNNPLSRRDFLKAAALTAGGAALVSGCSAPTGRAEAPVFDPNDSYWALEQPPANPPLAEDMAVDVAIVGGGYTGLSAAWHLAQAAPGLKIALLEARQVGHGASGRHGGMVLTQPGPESFEIAYDLETHKLTYDLTVESMRALQALVQSGGMDADLRLDGFVHTFLDEEDRPYYEEYVDQVQQAGIPLELWDEDETAQALGTEIYVGSVYDPNGGSVHGMKLVRALKQAVEGAGVRIFGDSPVLDVEEGEPVRLRVGEAGRTVLADALVLATNAYTSALGFFKYQVMPVHAQTAVTPPLSARQLDSIAWWSRLPFFDSRNALFHLVLTPDNRIVIGGGSAEYFYGNSLRYRGDLDAIGAMMLAELVRMYPALAGIQFETVWNGLLGMSFDGTPSVGVGGKHGNIYHGLAYSGQGVNLSFLFGDVIAALYQGKDHGWLATPYANNRLPFIPPEPFRWIGVQAAMKTYDWQDRR